MSPGTLITPSLGGGFLWREAIKQKSRGPTPQAVPQIHNICEFFTLLTILWANVPPKLGN